MNSRQWICLFLHFLPLSLHYIIPFSWFFILDFGTTSQGKWKLISPFLAPLTFYLAPTTVYSAFSSVAYVHTIMSIPMACIISHPSVQSLHLPAICPNPARVVLLKLRPSHVTPFYIFNTNVVKPSKSKETSFYFFTDFCSNIFDHYISEIISKR